MVNSVREAMTEDPRSIGPSAPVVEAARLITSSTPTARMPRRENNS